MKIGSAVLLIAMLVFLIPRARQAHAETPKAEKGDWQSAIIPIIIVLAFVALLMSL